MGKAPFFLRYRLKNAGGTKGHSGIFDHQPIADPRVVSDHVTGEAGLFEFAAEMGEMDSKIMRMFRAARTPHRVQQVGMGQDPPGMPSQLSQQGKLDGSQRHSNTRHVRAMGRKIDTQASMADHRLLFRWSHPAQQSPNPGKEFVGIEGFG